MQSPRAVPVLSYCNADTVVSRAEGRGHVVGAHTEGDGVFFQCWITGIPTLLGNTSPISQSGLLAAWLTELTS